MSSEISKERRKEIEVEIMQWQAIHKVKIIKLYFIVFEFAF